MPLVEQVELQLPSLSNRFHVELAAKHDEVTGSLDICDLVLQARSEISSGEMHDLAAHREDLSADLEHLRSFFNKLRDARPILEPMSNIRPLVLRFAYEYIRSRHE